MNFLVGSELWPVPGHILCSFLSWDPEECQKLQGDQMGSGDPFWAV